MLYNVWTLNCGGREIVCRVLGLSILELISALEISPVGSSETTNNLGQLLGRTRDIFEKDY